MQIWRRAFEKASCLLLRVAGFHLFSSPSFWCVTLCQAGAGGHVRCELCPGVAHTCIVRSSLQPSWTTSVPCCWCLRVLGRHRHVPGWVPRHRALPCPRTGLGAHPCRGARLPSRREAGGCVPAWVSGRSEILLTAMIISRVLTICCGDAACQGGLLTR